MMNKHSKILIVGHGIIESTLRQQFQERGYTQVFSCSAMGLNPAIQSSVYEFFQKEKPEYVFLASMKSGGIQANIDNPADFMYHNLESQNNIIYASWKFGVIKLLFLAGSCIYPKECVQPMTEDKVLTGLMEATSEPYSLAKAAGVKLCQAFRKQYGFNAIAMVPATIYGPGSSTNLETAHVMGALIGKFTQAVKEKQSEVVVWGTGMPRREFIYTEDFFEACLFLMNHYESEELINAGCGEDISISDLAHMIAAISGYKGKIVFDKSKPDGTMKKLLDNQKIQKLGWKTQVPLKEGIEKTFVEYRQGIIN